MRIGLRCLLLTTMTSTLVPAHALAQAPSSAATATAKRYVEDGRAAQDRGDYDAAIAQYKKAYELVPHPAMFFNMAQAHRLAGRLAQALALYERYLAEAPTGPQAPTARDWVADLKPRVAAEERAAEDARAAEQARNRDAALSKDDPHKTQQVPAGGSDPAQVRRIVGIVTGAVGVISLGVGIGYAAHGASLSHEADDKGLPEDDPIYDAGHRANAIAWTGVIGGVVLIGAGAGLYWWGHSDRRAAERVTLAPMLSDHHVGLVLSGSL